MRLLAEKAEELASRSVLCQTPEVKYAFMLKHSNEFTITTMCRVLVASRTGFYDSLVRQDKPRLFKHRQSA